MQWLPLPFLKALASFVDKDNLCLGWPETKWEQVFSGVRLTVVASVQQKGQNISRYGQLSGC